MSQAVIDDWDQFAAYLSAQPLCRWAAEKAHDLATGAVPLDRPPGLHLPHKPQKNDNADLAAALSSMA